MRPKIGIVRKLRRELMKRIAAMPIGPAERFHLLNSHATGRARRRRAFVPMGEIRTLWDQIAQHAPALLKEIPAGSSLLQRLRGRTVKLDQRQALLSSIKYMATWARILAIEKKVMRRKMRRGSASPSGT